MREWLAEYSLDSAAPYLLVVGIDALQSHLRRI
jgi:hypothetical protein